MSIKKQLYILIAVAMLGGITAVQQRLTHRTVEAAAHMDKHFEPVDLKVREIRATSPFWIGRGHILIAEDTFFVAVYLDMSDYPLYADQGLDRAQFNVSIVVYKDGEVFSRQPFYFPRLMDTKEVKNHIYLPVDVSDDLKLGELIQEIRLPLPGATSYELHYLEPTRKIVSADPHFIWEPMTTQAHRDFRDDMMFDILQRMKFDAREIGYNSDP